MRLILIEGPGILKSVNKNDDLKTWKTVLCKKGKALVGGKFTVKPIT